MTEQKFQMVAKTFQGLEDVLRDELISLGAENVEMGRRMVSPYLSRKWSTMPSFTRYVTYFE